jgi:hypothetical protein
VSHWSETKKINKRKADRHPLALFVQVGWEGAHGESRYMRVRCLDVSSYGLKLETLEPIPVRSFVNVRSDDRKLLIPGQASVRHCTRMAGRYHIGLEFQDVVRFAPPEAAPGS